MKEGPARARQETNQRHRKKFWIHRHSLVLEHNDDDVTDNEESAFAAVDISCVFADTAESELSHKFTGDGHQIYVEVCRLNARRPAPDAL